MADDEAEQERLSGGGCAAELRRLGERLQELERRLCESREPAVEAAAAYCRQLCQQLRHSGADCYVLILRCEVSKMPLKTSVLKWISRILEAVC